MKIGKFSKKLCVSLLSLIMVITLVPQGLLTAKAASADDAITWVQSQVGKAIDYDGVYGAQCVDLIKAYYNYLGVAPVSGNGADYATNSLPAGWARIPGGTPQKGDILVYSGNASNPYGHVAIFESTRVTYHQNFNSNQYIQKITTIAYNGFTNPYWGVIRPAFSGSNGVATSWQTFSTFQENYNAGIEATISTSSSVQFTRAGAHVWDPNGNLVVDTSEATSIKGYYMTISYNIRNELGISLSPGTTYTYQFWAEFGGSRYYSEKSTFKTTGGHNPEGAFDIASGGAGTVYVRGWAFDRDDLSASLYIHVYIGGPAGEGIGYQIDADKERKDVNTVYPGVGNNHGFDSTINVNLSGSQPVYVYAINVGEGSNTCLGNKTVTIQKNIQVTSLSLSIVSKELLVGDSFTNTATIFPADATDKAIIWASSNKSVATVENGKITGVGIGTAIISAKSSNGKEATCTVTVKDLPFTDVEESAWYYEDISYVYKNNLMSGTDSEHFSPNDKLTRAQFATILFRLSGESAVNYKPVFKDVPDNYWFTEGILWTNQAGIAGGYEGSNLFGINDPITREQLAAMIYRYADYKEYDTSGKASLDSFSDVEQISAFASDAVKWAVKSELLSGKTETLLDPKGNATRAECAAIISRFSQNIK